MLLFACAVVQCGQQWLHAEWRLCANSTAGTAGRRPCRLSVKNSFKSREQCGTINPCKVHVGIFVLVCLMY